MVSPGRLEEDVATSSPYRRGLISVKATSSGQETSPNSPGFQQLIANNKPEDSDCRNSAKWLSSFNYLVFFAEQPHVITLNRDWYTQAASQLKPELLKSASYP